MEYKVQDNELFTLSTIQKTGRTQDENFGEFDIKSNSEKNSIV